MKHQDLNLYLECSRDNPEQFQTDFEALIEQINTPIKKEWTGIRLEEAREDEDSPVTCTKMMR